MKTEQNHFKIGLFVIAATVLLVTGTVLLGAGHLFQKRIVIESYFDESVQGLERGSPVKFQGLQIGEVSAIDTVGFLYGAEQTEQDQDVSSRYVAVTMSITSYSAMGLSAETHAEEIQRAVDKGLRFRLASIGLTGTKFVEASFFDPLRAPGIEISWQPRYPYVPSAPDAINHIIENVEDLMERFAGTDFEGLLQNLDSAIVATREAVEGVNTPALSGEVLALASELRLLTERVNVLVGDPMLDSAPGDVAAILSSTRSITAEIETRLPALLESFVAASASLESGLAQLDTYIGDPGNQPALEDAQAIAANLRAASAELPQTIVQMRATLRDIQRIFGDNDNNVNEIFANLRLVTASLRSITAELSANPARVLFGDPPPRGPSNR